MEGKEVQTEKANNKPLVILLISLLTLIAIIVGAILLNLNNRNNRPDNGDLAAECLYGDDESITNCLDDKAFDYYEKDDCIKAMEVYYDVPENRIGQDMLQHLYNEAYSMGVSCEDKSSEEYWLKKIQQLNKGTEARS